MKVNILNEQSDLKIVRTQVRALVKEVISFEGQQCDEVSIHFVDVSRISQLHETFFQDPTPTDCISFPMDTEDNDPYRILGEIFVCPAVAIEYAIKHKGNDYEETSLYIVHGLLHLMGYDDIKANERKKMRIAESRHMRNLENRSLILTNR